MMLQFHITTKGYDITLKTIHGVCM